MSRAPCCSMTPSLGGTGQCEATGMITVNPLMLSITHINSADCQPFVQELQVGKFGRIRWDRWQHRLTGFAGFAVVIWVLSPSTSPLSWRHEAWSPRPTTWQARPSGLRACGVLCMDWLPWFFKWSCHPSLDQQQLWHKTNFQMNGIWTLDKPIET